MTHLRTALFLTATVVILGGARVSAQTVLPDSAAVADFDQRVKAYAALRDRQMAKSQKLNETAKPEEIRAAEQALAANMRLARPDARPGDLFTPAVEARFRVLLNPEMRGVRGQNNRGVIHDEGPGPGAFPLKVNDGYPKDQPLGTVPPDVLTALPRLPPTLEYRFVGRHLILHDTRANLIVDYIVNAIPKS